MSQSGYYQQASIAGDRVVFVCDDNLWSTTTTGGAARKLSNLNGECSYPKLSPDGKQIAFTSMDEGHPEIFIMPFEGGVPKRLTYLGGQACYACCWTPDGKYIVISADGKSPFFRHNELYLLSPDGNELKAMNLGHAYSYALDNNGRAVLGRNSNDPALWKRYKGGRAGELWIDSEAKGEFRRLGKINGNAVLPIWLKGRVYFLSDHDGIGNIYSLRADGRDLQRHTNHSEYYVRFPHSDGRKIIYSCAGDLYVFDPDTGKSVLLQIQAYSLEQQSTRKFADANYYLEHYSLHPNGHSVGLITRGQAFSMPLFEGPCIHHGVGSEVRYRHLEWLSGGNDFVMVDDAGGYERIAKHSAKDISREAEYITDEDIGRIICLEASPDGKMLAISNHRFELMLVDIEKKVTYVVDTSPAERIICLNWSPDSKWLAYSYFTHSNLSLIKVLNCRTYETHELTRPVRMDVYPCFDPEGKYLYFLSNREFKPVYDTQQFDLSFPQSSRPYLIILSKETASPFAPDTKPFIDTGAAAQEAKKESSTKEAGSKNKAKKKSTAQAAGTAATNGSDWVKIDFDGIKDRVIAFPFSEGSYSQLCAVKGRILFISFAMRGIPRDYNWAADDSESGSLITYDFAEQKTAVLQTGLQSMKLGPDKRTLIYRSKRRLRVIDALQATSKGPNGSYDTPGRATGFIDLARVSLRVEPRKEWYQMYREAWRLQQEHFWDEKMSQIDWDLAYDRYAKLLPKIRTRSELSDLIWEMQGELGTSHAYEFGGDKPSPKPYYKGFLACDLEYDQQTQGYRIKKILRGDSWDRESDSPLAEPGLNIEVGDLIIAVNGRKLSRNLSVDELLVKSGGQHVQLTLKRGSEVRSVTVRTLSSERYLRYRNWVENNRAIVSKATKDKVGYIHIPDMGPFGFAEFHRSYLSEFHHDGLIVDARYNRGGHVSSLLLEKLARRRVGYDVPRWGKAQPYPMESPAGPLVALTNEFAGSDGDIFSHCFKLYKLGPLVGKRTWGGVIGIHPRHRLVDFSLTTQPEFSFWFEDVGWSVENYGTEPDYDVDYRPQDYKNGEDPQLAKAIALLLQALKKQPVKMPSFKSRPSLPIPKRIKS
ncbi:MAG: PDZ domain-containing protein [Candidatus Obscuribacterales bacterium]|nr:PDZ domain-containing protein [Candidatus Obscuribacterales bacterium]